MRNESFFSAPQLKRDSLGRAQFLFRTVLIAMRWMAFLTAIGTVSCAGRNTGASPTRPEVATTSWCRYHNGSLQAILDALANFRPRPGFDLLTSGDQFATRATLVYTGESRQLAPQIRAFFALFFRVLYRTSDSLRYQHEERFIENGIDHWVPVQEPLIAEMGQELASGDSVTIFALYHGTYTAPDSTNTRVIGVTEFESRHREWFAKACGEP
jgi:hypothetical protein